MPPSTHTLTFPGAMNERVFWLYVWRVESPKGELLYVGRTGDSASANASSPIKRMGQNLDPKARGNALYSHLQRHGLKPQSCTAFNLVVYGPLFPEEKHWFKHRKSRDKVAALEKELADTLGRSHYCVMNTVHCKKTLDNELWHEVREAFAVHFPKLSRPREQ